MTCNSACRNWDRLYSGLKPWKQGVRVVVMVITWADMDLVALCNVHSPGWSGTEHENVRNQIDVQSFQRGLRQPGICSHRSADQMQRTWVLPGLSCFPLCKNIKDKKSKAMFSALESRIYQDLIDSSKDPRSYGQNGRIWHTNIRQFLPPQHPGPKREGPH